MAKWIMVVLVVFAAVAAGRIPAFAHGKIDQSATGPEHGIAYIPGERLEQTFRPASDILSGVSLGMERLNGGPANVTVTIRSGGSAGTFLGSATILVPDFAPGEPFDFSTPTRLVHFDFPDEISLIPDETYVIQVDADAPGPGWVSLGSDVYPGGSGWARGQPFPNGEDFIFETCGNGAGKPCKTKTTILEKLNKSHGPDCIDFKSDTVCRP